MKINIWNVSPPSPLRSCSETATSGFSIHFFFLFTETNFMNEFARTICKSSLILNVNIHGFFEWFIESPTSQMMISSENFSLTGPSPIERNQTSDVKKVHVYRIYLTSIFITFSKCVTFLMNFVFCSNVPINNLPCDVSWILSSDTLLIDTSLLAPTIQYHCFVYSLFAKSCLPRVAIWFFL